VSRTATRLPRVSPHAAVLLLAAAASWAAVIWWAGDMDGMTGTMGLGFAGFLGVWTLMMAAMMLPGVVPLASLWLRTTADDPARVAGFVAGYVLVWAAAGVPAFGLAWLTGELAENHETAATVAAVVLFAACGLYQLTPLKDRCLRHCRSPLGLLLHYGSFQGSFRDLRVGLHHGAYCLGCCWGLMLLLVVAGVMNLWFMVGLAVVILLEKRWAHGRRLATAVGIAALVCAVAVIWIPDLAPGLDADDSMEMEMQPNMDDGGM
jgi:predicted metal-binding membrane protein